MKNKSQVVENKVVTSTNAIFAIVLVLYALFIWFRDTTWISTSDDTLPILVAIPLFFWIGAPWKLRDHPLPLSTKLLWLALIFFFLGSALNLTWLFTVSWSILLWSWLSTIVTAEMIPSLKKLMVLPLMAFPWVSMDASKIGWWFRLSGAWATAKFFELIGQDVQQEGTLLVVNKLPISVEVACAGLNTLQSMLIAGSVVCFLILGNSQRYWWNLPLLVGMSWIANTARIILISAAALAISPKFAKGNFHVLGGWVVIMLMFCLCWIVFALQEPSADKKEK